MRWEERHQLCSRIQTLLPLGPVMVQKHLKQPQSLDKGTLDSVRNPFLNNSLILDRLLGSGCNHHRQNEASFGHFNNWEGRTQRFKQDIAPLFSFLELSEWDNSKRDDTQSVNIQKHRKSEHQKFHISFINLAASAKGRTWNRISRPMHKRIADWLLTLWITAILSYRRVPPLRVRSWLLILHRPWTHVFFGVLVISSSIFRALNRQKGAHRWTKMKPYTGFTFRWFAFRARSIQQFSWRNSQPIKATWFIHYFIGRVCLPHIYNVNFCILSKPVISININIRNNFQDSSDKLLWCSKIRTHLNTILRFKFLPVAIGNDGLCWWVLIRPWTWCKRKAQRRPRPIHLHKFFLKLTDEVDIDWAHCASKDYTISSL